MKRVKLIFFGPGQKAGHEGVTYMAKLHKKGGLCSGCASNRRGGPCECPGGRVCADVIDGSNIIFKEV